MVEPLRVIGKLLGRQPDRAALWKQEAQRLTAECADLKARLRDLRERLQALSNQQNQKVIEILRRADLRALREFDAGNAPDARPAAPSGQLTQARLAASLVLGTYNRLELLKLTIDSIRKNGCTRPYEIIVIDGGSNDGTIEWLVQQADVITIVQHNRVAGKRLRSWGYFMNLGFKAAQGKYVLMLSDDCLLLPRSIENGLAHAETLEGRGRAVGGVAFYFRDWPRDRNYHVQKTLGGMLMVNHGLFSREALHAVGYADEDLYSFYKADSDLALKIWQAGYEIVDCRDALIEHLLLPEEELRIHNSETLDRDRATLIERWKGIYVDPTLPDLFHTPARIELEHADLTNTVAAFASLRRALGHSCDHQGAMNAETRHG